MKLYKISLSDNTSCRSSYAGGKYHKSLQLTFKVCKYRQLGEIPREIIISALQFFFVFCFFFIVNLEQKYETGIIIKNKNRTSYVDILKKPR